MCIHTHIHIYRCFLLGAVVGKGVAQGSLFFRSRFAGTKVAKLFGAGGLKQHRSNELSVDCFSERATLDAWCFWIGSNKTGDVKVQMIT